MLAGASERTHKHSKSVVCAIEPKVQNSGRCGGEKHCSERIYQNVSVNRKLEAKYDQTLFNFLHAS